ncbi:glycosyl hydrolase 9B18 [Prunus dulcis]|uniref:cellulase n=1 Tax=Prunus dulcis TaxID=3755 RepID=A0A4Y1RZZ2_PRUDU|nr:glycosyl hydrolase 9B18 [Prunus dulcis]
MKKTLSFPHFLASIFALALISLPNFASSSHHDYQEALSKAILFFEGQRSGFLPQDQRQSWRANSALSDGWTYNTDLTGGYYDAGDNVKFGFPMAFTTTMLAWSVIEFGDSMPPNELRNALVAIRWATDYLLKTLSQPNRIFVQTIIAGKGQKIWTQPGLFMPWTRPIRLLMSPERRPQLWQLHQWHSKSSDPGYSDTLLRNAKKAFELADTYRGAYSDNPDVRDGVCPFYCDFDGYQDELLWGAAWLSRVTQDSGFFDYIQNNGKTLGAEENINEFGWDNKHAGLNVLISKEVLEGNMYTLESYKASADSFMCTLIPDSSSSHIEYTPGGLIYKPGAAIYSIPTTLRQIAKKQVDYILGDNPMGCHTWLVMVTISHNAFIIDHPQPIACKEGSVYFNSSSPNPNVLVGALVGGPGEDDVITMIVRILGNLSQPLTSMHHLLVFWHTLWLIPILISTH